MDNLDFDAPTFGSLSELDRITDDNYFDQLVEEYVKKNVKTEQSNMRKSLSCDTLYSEPADLHKTKRKTRTPSHQSVKSLSSSKDNLDKKPKFVSMAEAMLKFQAATPKRFRSQPRFVNFNQTKINEEVKYNLKYTIPESPKLCTKSRYRPVYYKPPDKREEEIIEEMRKFTFKAQPIPKVVVMKKEPTSPPKDVDRKKHQVVMKPFSFDEKIKQVEEKKKAKVQQILEEEKRLRTFRANPVLPAVAKSSAIPTNVQPKLYDIKPKKDCENVQPATFKAREPTVLHRKPFVPVKKERPLKEITEFTLNSERRAKEREEFEKRKRAKAEQLEIDKKNYREYLDQLAKDEVEKLRKQAVPKTQPFKPCKPFVVQPSSKPLTNPTSPQLSYKNRTHSSLHSSNSNL